MTTSTPAADAALDAPIIIGLGRTGLAVAGALRRRGFSPTAVDDRPDDRLRGLAADLGVPLLAAPSGDETAAAVERSSVVLPSPGVPDRHPAFAAARRADVPINSEFDLARRWDDRPIAAVTATNGKTTITMLVESILRAAGKSVVAAGNTDIPLVEAIDDASTDCFVVEASSFRLGHTAQWAPAVAAWMNFAPDHLDVHADLAAYETAKAAIWRDRKDGDVAIADLADPVVARHAPDDAIDIGRGDYRIDDGHLVVDGHRTLALDALWSPFPHDRQNALAAAAMALPLGADLDAVVGGLSGFRGLPHRVELVAEYDGVCWYDDSKATTPHATRAATAGFSSVVLIAGGRNKGVDLRELVEDAAGLRAIVAIGEAGAEIVDAFAHATDVVTAASMADAVHLAAGRAQSGDAVLLSPGCASFDWYSSYAERGDDFATAVRSFVNGDRS